jgi:hypothetical protein
MAIVDTRLKYALSIALALAASVGLGLSSCGKSDSGGGNGYLNPDGGDAGCGIWLSGLVPYGDAGLLLDDAGFTCVPLLLRDDAGVHTSLALTPLGPLPAGVESFNTVVVFDAGTPPQQDAGSDAGPLTLGSPLVLSATASVLVNDSGATTAFALQKPPPAGGSLSLFLRQVADAGFSAGQGTVLDAHGSMDAVLPYSYGPRPDGGTIDAGMVVNVHAEF